MEVCPLYECWKMRTLQNMHLQRTVEDHCAELLNDSHLLLQFTLALALEIFCNSEIFLSKATLLT